eukprot:m.18950 g.18950  ORF g.18950 m.18950 type:complete len:229 (+) comp3388_c0_seq2:22-708(+)
MVEVVPLKFFLVEHIKGDNLGLLLAGASLLPFFLVCSLATLVAVRRDLFTLSFLLGILLNEIFNHFLKKHFQEVRPQTHLRVANEHGMPSSHAQFMAFFAVFFTLFVLVRWRHRSHDVIGKMFDLVTRWASVIVVSSASGIVALSRVYLGYHTEEQVLVGLYVGAAAGTLWFSLTHFLFSRVVFRRIERWPIAQYLLLRDTGDIDDVMRLEYDAIFAEKNRKRKAKHT